MRIFLSFTLSKNVQPLSICDPKRELRPCDVNDLSMTLSPFDVILVQNVLNKKSVSVIDLHFLKRDHGSKMVISTTIMVLMAKIEGKIG